MEKTTNLKRNLEKTLKGIFISSVHKVCTWKYLPSNQHLCVSAILIFDPCTSLINSINWFWLRRDSCVAEDYLSERDPAFICRQLQNPCFILAEWLIICTNKNNLILFLTWDSNRDPVFNNYYLLNENW